MGDEKDYTLYLSSLPDQVTDSLLLELFSQAGPVDNVSLKKGFGFVTFTHHISIPYVLQLFEGLKLFGRQIVMKPRDGSMYANQFNQRRPGNHSGNRDHSTPSTSQSRQMKMPMDPRSITPLVGGPNANQPWNYGSVLPAGLQPQRPSPSGQMGFSGSFDNRTDRNSSHGGFRDQQSRNSFDGGREQSGFRGGRDQMNGRHNDSGSGSKSYRNWDDGSASKNPNMPYSGRRDSHDRGRFNDRPSSGGFGGNDWNRGGRGGGGGHRTSFGGNGESGRSRRDQHFDQRNDRSDGGYKQHGEKPYSRPQGNRSHEGFPRNDFNRFGNGGRR